jgi:hypothetical protein
MCILLAAACRVSVYNFCLGGELLGHCRGNNELNCAPIVLAEHCPGTTAEENQGGVTT